LKIKKKAIKILMITLALILCLQTKIFASTLTLNVTTDKDDYKVSEIVEVTVDWEENMQASSFKIGYDSEKLEFTSASINENFYNSKNKGEISINWASFEGKDLTQIKFQFKALKEGNADVGIKEVSAFADGNLLIPSSYDISTSGTKTVLVKANDEIESNPGNSEEPEEPDNNQKPNDDKDYDNQEDNPEEPSVLPETGIETKILILIIIVGMLSIILFIKNRKFSEI